MIKIVSPNLYGAPCKLSLIKTTTDVHYKLQTKPMYSKVPNKGTGPNKTMEWKLLEKQ